MMRRILIDYPRTKHRVRRGGVHNDLRLEDALTITVSETDCDLLCTRRSIKPASRKGSPIGKGRRTEILQRFGRGGNGESFGPFRINHQTRLAHGKGVAAP
jgi:hypothetical protein